MKDNVVKLPVPASKQHGGPMTKEQREHQEFIKKAFAVGVSKSVENMPDMATDKSDIPGTPPLDARTFVVRQLRLDKQERQIINDLIRLYDFNSSDALALIKTERREIKKGYANYMSEICQVNVGILRQMLQDALDEGKKSLALEIVKELNKMGGVYDATTYIQNNFLMSNADVQITFQ